MKSESRGSPLNFSRLVSTWPSSTEFLHKDTLDYIKHLREKREGTHALQEKNAETRTESQPGLQLTQAQQLRPRGRAGLGLDLR